MAAVLREALGRLCLPATVPPSSEPRSSFPDPSSPDTVLKMIRPLADSSSRAVLEFFRESLYLIECESRLTVRVLGIAMSPQGFQLRIPRYSNGSLHDFLVTHKKTMTPTQLTKCAFGVIAAIDHLHRHEIHHRDIKAENILLTDSLEPVLCDLGSSRVRTPGDGYINSARIGTPNTHAPESHSYAKRAGFATDIWGYGMVLYVLLTRKMPWTDYRPEAILRRVEKGARPPFPEGCRRNLKMIALMERCTVQVGAIIRVPAIGIPPKAALSISVFRRTLLIQIRLTCTFTDVRSGSSVPARPTDPPFSH
jgi:serine/threonine protein kinase